MVKDLGLLCFLEVKAKEGHQLLPSAVCLEVKVNCTFLRCIKNQGKGQVETVTRGIKGHLNFKREEKYLCGCS